MFWEMLFSLIFEFESNELEYAHSKIASTIFTPSFLPSNITPFPHRKTSTFLSSTFKLTTMSAKFADFKNSPRSFPSRHLIFLYHPHFHQKFLKSSFIKNLLPYTSTWSDYSKSSADTRHKARDLETYQTYRM